MEEMESMSNYEKRMTNGSEHAFPHMAINGATIKLEGGLSKREYFAAMAMQGVLAADNIMAPILSELIEQAARRSVLLADALIAELDKK